MSPITLHRLTLRTILGYLSICAVIGLLVWYVAFQARFIIAGPMVNVHTIDGVSTERTIVVEGEARNIVEINLNGRRIYTDERGYFKETLVLENGYTIATLNAKDRYGRTTSVSRSFVYTPLTDNS